AGDVHADDVLALDLAADGQVADMPVTGADPEPGPEILLDGLGLGRRLDDDQVALARAGVGLAGGRSLGDALGRAVAALGPGPGGLLGRRLLAGGRLLRLLHGGGRGLLARRHVGTCRIRAFSSLSGRSTRAVG